MRSRGKKCSVGSDIKQEFRSWTGKKFVRSSGTVLLLYVCVFYESLLLMLVVVFLSQWS